MSIFTVELSESFEFERFDEWFQADGQPRSVGFSGGEEDKPRESKLKRKDTPHYLKNKKVNVDSNKVVDRVTEVSLREQAQDKVGMLPRYLGRVGLCFGRWWREGYGVTESEVVVHEGYIMSPRLHEFAWYHPWIRLDQDVRLELSASAVFPGSVDQRHIGGHAER